MQDLYQLYLELEEIALAEWEFIKNDDYKSLKSKLDEKNKLIKKIDSIDENQYFKKLYEQNRDKALAEKKHSQIYQLLKKISELEEKKIKLLKEKKIDVKNKILELYNREKSIKGYRKEEKYEAKFFDEKS
ncbi:MAG: hypothetical protein ACOC17_00360 [Halanaerobium sp.]